MWNALENGHGGIDWAGLDLIVSWLGVTDLDDLLHRLMAIKTHRPPEEDRPGTDKGDA